MANYMKEENFSVSDILVFSYALIPFVIFPFLYYPYITGKTFFFIFLSFALFSAWFHKNLMRNDFPISFSPISVFFLAFIVSIFLADLYGMDFRVSMISRFSRMDGLVLWACVFCFLFLLNNCFYGNRQWKSFFIISVAVSSSICLINVFEYFGHDDAARAKAVLGNSNFLASYISMHIFLCFLLISRVGGRNIWILLMPVLLLHAYVLMLTGTRGAILALACAGALMISVYFLYRNFSFPLLISVGKKAANIFLLSILFSLITSFALISAIEYGNGISGKKTVASNSESGVSEKERIFNYDLRHPTISLRLELWGIALRAWRESPWTGWGQGHFDKAAVKFFRPSLADKDPWYDRPHNEFLYWLTASGLPGLLAFLCIQFAAFFMILCAPGKVMVALERASLTGALTAFNVQCFFVFNTISVLVPYVIILGYTAYRAGNFSFTWNLRFKCSEKRALRLSLLVVFLLTVMLIYFFWKPFYSCLNIGMAAREKAEQSPVKSFERLKRAFYCGPPWNREALENMILLYDGQLHAFQNQEAKNNCLDFIVKGISMDTRKYPEDAKKQVFYASFYRRTGEIDKALFHLDNALGACPNHPEILMEAGRNFCLRGDFDAGLKCFRRARELCPGYKPAEDVLKLWKAKSGNREK